MNKILYIDLSGEERSIHLTKNRRKNISLEIDPGGDILVKAPTYLNNGYIKKFIQSKESWITKRISKIEEGIKKYPLTENSTVPFLGNQLTLTFGTHKRGVKHNKESVILPDNCSDIKSALRKWYKNIAKDLITEEVINITGQIGVKFNRIFIKEQKTRWGSCSGKNNLNFNWKIVLTEPELLKYLVIHEVCHLVHMNHSKKYWNLVEQYDPNYRLHRKRLQDAGYYLVSFLK